MQLHATSTSNPFTDNIDTNKTYNAELHNLDDDYNFIFIIGNKSGSYGYHSRGGFGQLVKNTSGLASDLISGIGLLTVDEDYYLVRVDAGNIHRRDVRMQSEIGTFTFKYENTQEGYWHVVVSSQVLYQYLTSHNGTKFRCNLTIL